MAEKIFGGIYAIVLTPFREDGKVDYQVLEKQIEKSAMSKDLTGLVVCGSTGEFTRLSFEENVQLMKTVKEANHGRKQLICGATAGDSYTASKYVESIYQMGADGILLAPPFYFKLNEEELFEYYADAITNNVENIPIIGYNIPQCTNPISVGLFEQLLQFDCVKGYKNSWNDMQEITTEIALRDSKRKDVAMFTGLDACLYGTLALGGDGVFSAISYLLPDVMNYIFKNYRNGNQVQAFQCQCDLIRLIDIVNGFTFPYGYRILAEASGFPLGEGREAVPVAMRTKAENAKEKMRHMINKIRGTYLVVDALKDQGKLTQEETNTIINELRKKVF